MAGFGMAVALAAPQASLAASGGAGLPRLPYLSTPSDPGGIAPSPGLIQPMPAPQPAPVPGALARLSGDGRTATPPASAPVQVRRAIYAANRITQKPYRYGGGHGGFRDRGYDCSGSVSYALHGGGLLASPLDSSSFMRWGESGPGQWITVYTNPGHAYLVIAGLRFDTSGPGESGPRWRQGVRSSRSFRARHPSGF
jgi:cell wall-associated NlpC family hydrolase